MKKKIFALLLAAATAFCAAGCAGSYEDTLKDEYEDGKLVIDFFGHGLDSMQGLTPDSQKILDYVENKFQIKFKTTTATVGSAPTLLNQLISGGDVPDMFIHFLNEPAYSKWLKEKYLFNYSEYLDDYPALKANFTALGTEKVVKNFLGGYYYSFPIVLHSNAESGALSVEMAVSGARGKKLETVERQGFGRSRRSRFQLSQFLRFVRGVHEGGPRRKRGGRYDRVRTQQGQRHLLVVSAFEYV